MKSILLNFNHFHILVLFLLISIPMSAQEEKHFSEDPGVFIQEITELLNQTSNKVYLNMARQMMRELESSWDGGRFSVNAKTNIIQFTELLHQNQLKPFPEIYNYFNLLVLFGRSELPTESLIAWHKHATLVLTEGNRRRFGEAIRFVSQLLQHERLAGDEALGWYARNANYYFLFDTAFKIRFNRLDLVCASRRDSSTIERTSGLFVPDHNLWYGRGGKLYWSRFSMDTDKVFAELRHYSIDVTFTDFTADSVVFRNKNYFNFPVQGQLAEKVTSGPPGSRTSYPKFSSYFKSHRILNIFKRIDFEGGINMEGPRFVGMGDENKPALLHFRRGDKIVSTLRTLSLFITNDRLVSERVAAAIYFENDSIYHPGLRLQYTDSNRNLVLTRSEQGIQDSPFFSFYHQMNMYVEALYWQIDSPQITFRRMEGPGDESRARFESMNLFSMNDFTRLQVIDEIHPIFIIHDFRSQYGNTSEIRVSDLAYFMKKPEEQIVTQLLRFAAQGYLVYNPINRTASLTKRFDHILAAWANKADYDIIQLRSVTTGRYPNAILDLETFNLQINGVPEVELSKPRLVSVFPANEQIVLKSNRDFHFNGLIKAGLFNFHADEVGFVYDSFKLSMTHIDSVSFSVRDESKPVSGDQLQLAKISNQLTDLNGTLFIDDINNKSGSDQLPSYPLFSSHDESYVYFEKPEIQNGTLKQDDFYFVIDEFTIDSLDNFNSSRWKFDGYLVSAGIFPVFRESLVVMDDYSLGFNHTAPREGYEMYGNKGRYYNNIHLSDRGFLGEGNISYLSSKAESDKFSFYPNAVRGQLANFRLNEKSGAITFPKASGENLHYLWESDTNFVTLKTNKTPIILFDSASFSGNLELSPYGMKGSGMLKFAKAVINAADFGFERKSVKADHADFKVLTSEYQREAFVASSYKAHIDFANQIGSFTYIDSDSELSFPFNQYICTLDEAIWLMNEKLVRLNNNRIRDNYGMDTLNFDQLLDIDLSGSEFKSLHPDQESLSFFSLEAEYDMQEYAIQAKDVKILRVADAAIFPSDGLITIFEDAQIEPLKQATIITDTASRLHRINAANVELISKNSFTGDGYYDYIDNENNMQTISFQMIGVENKRTFAFGEIADSLDFMLNPYFSFAGKVELKSERKMLEFDGSYRIKNPCSPNETGWTAFKALIDPSDIHLPIKKGSVDNEGLRLYTGLYHNPSTDQTYSLLQGHKLGSTDHEIISFDGKVWFNPTHESFEVLQQQGDQEQLVYSLTTQRCIATGHGQLELGMQMPFVEMLTVGEFRHLLIPDSLYINALISFNFPFSSELMALLADSLIVSNMSGINLTSGNYLTALGELLPPSEMGIIRNDIELYGSPRNVPEPFLNTITFSDLKLKWNPETRSFISMGSFGISNSDRVQVNKLVNGFIEIERGRNRQGFTLYLDLGKGQWYFFTYSNGIMQVMSSSQHFNSLLLTIDQPQRIVENKQTNESYEYVISTRRRVTDFVRRMQSLDL